MVRSRTGRHCKQSTPVVLLLLLLALPLHAGEYPRLSRSLFWQPYTFDGKTIALFHLDEKGKDKDRAGDISDELDLDDDINLEPTTTDGRSSTNANKVGQAAALSGPCELVADGRLDGGIRLKGGSSRLVITSGEAFGNRTVELWVKLDSLPKDNATLVYMFQKGRLPRGDRIPHPVTLQATPQGKLQLRWNGNALAPTKEVLNPKAWTHIALAYSRSWPDESCVYIYANGHRIWKHKAKDSINFACALNCFLVGNDPSGKTGFHGWVDEIRFSRAVRSFYAYDLDWAPAKKKAPRQAHLFRGDNDLLFHLQFNDNLKPAVSAPDTKSPKDKITSEDRDLNPDKSARLFPKGVEGSGLMLGDGGLRPLYSGKGNLLPPQGTIAFWMQPVNWDNFTRDNKYDQTNPTTFGLFQFDCTTVKGSNEAIYRKVGPLFQFTVNMHMPEAVDNPVQLCPGRWRHIAMTWEGGKFTYYVDGRKRHPGGAFHAAIEIRTAGDPYPYKKANPKWWTESKPVNIRFRENRYWEQRGTPMPRTVIDDYRIYRRPLAPSEIANLAALLDPRQETRELPVADMFVHYNGVSGKVKTKLLPLLKNYQDLTSATVTVTEKTSGKVIGSQSGDFDKQKRPLAILVTTPPMTFTTYVVTAALKAGDKVMGSVKQQFTRTAPPWWKSQAGISDKVMPEWTPMAVKDKVVSLWGRKIHFADNGLPAKVISAGEDILAKPIQLQVFQDGKPVQPKWQPLEVKAAKEVRVDLKAQGSTNEFRLHIDSCTEFDGMMWYTVTLDPMHGATPKLTGLEVVIPYTAANAQLIHRWSGNREFRDPKAVYIGKLGDGKGTVFESTDKNIRRAPHLRGSFIPYVMLTGMQRGMAWFAENDKGWTKSMEEPAVTIARDQGNVYLVLHVITAPTVLAAPLTFAFGLHPIPVKPINKLWRRSPVYTNTFPDTFSGNNLKGRKGPSTFNTYIEDDWESVNRRINGEGKTKGAAGLKGLYARDQARLKKKYGRDPLPIEETVPGLYWDMQWTGRHPEHTREWTETWGLGHGDLQHYDRAFVDYCAWAWEQWLTKTNKFVRGIYFDDCWGTPQFKVPGPAAYKLPDGHVQPGFQFRGYRERMKRTRQIFYDHGVAPHITAHTTHTLLIPYHSFFDLILDGEDHYGNPASQADFIDKWSLARMQFMHNAKWGLVTTWLGWHGNSLKKDKWPTWTFKQERAYRAMINLHDIIPNLVPAEAEVVQIPYWDNQGLARHEHEGLLVGGWKYKKTCRVMLLNTTRKRLEAKVVLDPKVMGLSTPKIKHIDPTLLTYFDNDVTQLKKPKGPTPDLSLGADDDDELGLEEKPEDIPIAERKAKDPDGKFTWEGTTLTCPIRPHDYRFFEFLE